MNGIFGQLDQSFKAVWVSNSGSVARGILHSHLGPEQIAIFAADNYCALDEQVSLSAPNFKTNKRLIIKQGLHPFAGQTNTFLSRQDSKPRQTFEFEASDIISWKGEKARKGARPEMVAIGYDGLDASRTLGGTLDAKPLHVNIRLSGEPIKRFFHRNFIDHRFVIDKNLCLGACDCFDACGNVPADLIADAVIKHFETQELFVPGGNGGFYRAPLRQFVKANKIKKCTDALVSPTLIEVKKWTISIPDDGKTTIALLQAEYPAYKITLESRIDGVSTYAFWMQEGAVINEVSTLTVTTGVTTTTATITVNVNGTAYTTASITSGADQNAVALAIKTAIGSSAANVGGVVTITGVGADTDTSVTTNTTGLAVTAATTTQGDNSGFIAPADFTITNHVQPICDTCPTCPEAYTEVVGLRVVQVRKAFGAAAPTITGSVSSVKMSSSLANGDVYIIKVPLATSDTTISTDLGVSAEYQILGTESKSCVGSTATFEWANCDESRFKTTKKFMITLPDTDCEQGESRLAELQAAYPTLVIADLAEGSCLHSYETTVESDMVAPEDCDRLVTYKFKQPAGFEGYQWVDFVTPVTEVDCTVPTAPTVPCCVAGVILETAWWDSKTGECTYGWSNWHPNNKKPVRIQVNIHSLDYSNNPCDETKYYSTIIQKLAMDMGTSGEVVQEYERNFLLYENKYWSSNPYVNDIDGFVMTAKAHLLYDQYTLRLKRRQYGNSYMLKDQGAVDYIFYVPTGEGKDLEGLINELVLSAGNPDLTAVYL
jgi:hypothetical protein